MWLYAEAWLPLLTIAIAAALCFGVADGSQAATC